MGAIKLVYCFDQDNDVALIVRNYTKVGASTSTGREASMRRAVICVTAGLAAVAIGFGLNSATSRSTTETSVSKATTTPAISIWEMHNLAHVEFLPVQQFEDQSLVFAEKLTPTSVCRRPIPVAWRLRYPMRLWR